MPLGRIPLRKRGPEAGGLPSGGTGRAAAKSPRADRAVPVPCLNALVRGTVMHAPQIHRALRQTGARALEFTRLRHWDAQTRVLVTEAAGGCQPCGSRVLNVLIKE